MSDKSEDFKKFFGDKVVARVEGNEYLLYNRKTDGLYMLSDKGYKALQSLADHKNIDKASEKISESYKMKPDEAKAFMNTFLSEMKEGKLLNDEFINQQPDIKKIPPEAIKKEGFKDLRSLGDLTISAWAIAAKSIGE